MSTPAGTGILALLDLPDPAVLGSGNDAAMYGLAARLLTPSDAPAEWNEPTPVACVDLRAAIGSRLDKTGLDAWERLANEAAGQDEECSSVQVTLAFDGGVLRATIQAVGAAGPFRFVLVVEKMTAQILKGS